MPLCQGLPTGPCPAAVNDRSVKSTQGDLFLCRSCEEARFPTNLNNSNKCSTGKGGKSSSAAKRANQKQPDQMKNSTRSDVQCTACHVCCETITDTAGLQCDICANSFHIKCTGLNEQAFDMLSQIIAVTGWVCNTCRNSARQTFVQLQSGQAKLAEEVAELKFMVAKLQATVHDMTTAAPAPVPQTSERVVTVMREAIKRKKTVVVSGLQPVQGVDDATIFTTFCENNLALKPYVDQRQIKRVGKSVPQKLVVSLLSEHSAAEVLCRAKELRRASDPEVRCVYINPDMSREEAKAAYERRVARRQTRGISTPQPGTSSASTTNQAPTVSDNTAVALDPSAPPFRS